MSKIIFLSALVLGFLFQTQPAVAQQMGAPGEPRYGGYTVILAAQIIDGTGADPIKTRCHRH